MHAVEERERAESIPVPVVLFDVLLSVASILLVTVVAVAFFSRSVYRMKTWFALHITTVLYCISFFLLVGHQAGPDPPFSLCLIQSWLIYAAPPGLSAAALIFVIELHLRLRAVILAKRVDEKIIDRMLWLPPFTHVLVFWVSIVISLSHLPQLERNDLGYYCHINGLMPALFVGSLSAVMMFTMLILEVYMVVVIYFYSKRPPVKKIDLKLSDFPLGLFIRTATYSSLAVAMIFTDILFNLSDTGTRTFRHVLYVIFAMLPLSIALVFGSQTDILRVLLFCKGDDDDPDTVLLVRASPSPGVC